MSRFRKVVHGVASGYFVLSAAAVYSLAILPLGLHYLSAERVGLWTLMASIAGYLSQIDLGMSASLARLLIDHKDDRETTIYGSLIKTGWLVLIVQGSMIAAAGFFIAPPLASALDIQPELRSEFVLLMRWMTANLALSFFTKIFTHLLQAHQRMDLINYSQILNLLLGFVFIWYFLDRTHRVVSLAWATVITTVIGSALLGLACWKWKLLPASGKWGNASWPQFKGIFAYGKDIFLVSLGAQLIVASQPMIITRQLGIVSATLWYAGTRMFNLISQAIWRLSDMALPAFAEMIVHDERALLRERYKTIVMLTASLAGFAAVSYAVCNSLFVWVWTSFSKKEALIWPAHNDVLLGAWTITMAILHCHNVFVLTTKKVGFMRYVFFVEGVIFVCLALLASRWFGVAGIIASSILCSFCFSGAYGVWRVTHYFDLPISSVAFGWLVPMGRVLLLFAPIAVAAYFLSNRVADPIIRLGVRVLVCACAGSCIFLRFGVPAHLQRELLQRAPAAFNTILRKVFVSPH